MKKKILSICLVAVIAVMAIAGASLAYFTAEDSAENVFTVGNVAIDLAEPNWETTGKVEAEDVYPGEPLAKDPTVTNTGKNQREQQACARNLPASFQISCSVILTHKSHGSLRE